MQSFFKDVNIDIQTKCGACSKLTLKTLEKSVKFVYNCQNYKYVWLFIYFAHCSTVFIVDFEQNSHIGLVTLPLTLNKFQTFLCFYY